MRKVFFSFKYHDVSRSMIVRNSWVTRGCQAAGFVDSAEFEQVKRQGDHAIMNWINNQLHGTSVTVVLIGQQTCNSRWVKYEIDKSIEKGNGIMGIDISQIKDFSRGVSFCCGRHILPDYAPFYNWVNDNGYANIGNWIEHAAWSTGR